MFTKSFVYTKTDYVDKTEFRIGDIVDVWKNENNSIIRGRLTQIDNSGICMDVSEKYDSKHIRIEFEKIMDVFKVERYVG